MIRLFSILTSLSAVSRVLGLLRLIFIGNFLGTTAHTDAFFAALNSIYTLSLIVGDQTKSALMKVATGYRNRYGLIAETRVLRENITVVLAVSTIVTLFVIIFAKDIAYLILPKASLRGQDYLTTSLVVMSPVIILAIMSHSIAGLLNLKGHFVTPAFMPILFNIFVIFGTVPLFGWTPNHLTLSIAVSLGTLMGFVLQVCVSSRLGLLTKVLPKVPTIEGFATIKVSTILSIGQIILLIADLIVLRLVSGLTAGSISIFFYGRRLYRFGGLTFKEVIGTLMFPDYLNRLGNRDSRGGALYVAKTINVTIYLTIPFTIMAVILSPKLIPYAFFFKPDIGLKIAKFFSVIVFSVPGHCIGVLAKIALISLGKQGVIVRAALIYACAFVLFSIIFQPYFSIYGFALAEVIAISFECIYLVFVLNSGLRLLQGVNILKSLAKSIVINFIVGLSVWYVYNVTIPYVNDNILTRVILAVLFLISIAIISPIVCREEYSSIERKIRKRYSRN